MVLAVVSALTFLPALLVALGPRIDAGQLPLRRIAAFDGENADPANGRRLGDTIRAFSPWGELAFALAKEPGYRLVEQSDHPANPFIAQWCASILDWAALEALYTRAAGGRLFGAPAKE